MEEVNSYGAIKAPMMEISFKIIFMELENMCGLMEEYIMVSGLIIKWKVKELLLGVMEESMSANINMIKNMEMVHLNGQMVENILVNGIRENNMEKVLILKKVKKGKAFGKWGKEYNGPKIMKAQMHEVKFFLS